MFPDGGGALDAGPDVSGLDDLALMTALAGLWAGPATQTPLGAFPTMNVDFRPVGSRALFGRVDLDGANALRFGFTVETVNGVRRLTYRNGGYFLGILRDMRADLRSVEHGPERWRFCHVERGCDYIDARFTLSDSTTLVLDVKVRGQQHLLWQATRREARTVPSTFPEQGPWAGSLTDPFPVMPSLEATVSWTTPLPAEREVWISLSATACGFTFSCVPSRTLAVKAAAGATRATLTLEQLHLGTYFATAVLDRNGNIRTLLRPDSGDGVSIPDTSVTVAATGTTRVSLPIITSVP
ncbi:MAG: hypothetical protein JNG84_01440 [Archangium sp.]|nr:hypothetical protein [Archangium sp.]